MSADSLAMSTAVSTEMPTSAARNAGPSLMPSPRKPTTWPSRCSAWITRTFCCGFRRANTGVSRVASMSSSSLIASIFGPVRYLSTWMPTCRQTLRVTTSLSPVRIFTATPFALSAWIASAALSFGGSRNATKPIMVRSFSSSREYADFTSISRTPSASARKPSSFISRATPCTSSSFCCDKASVVFAVREARADRERLGDRTLGDEEMLARLVAYDHRHAPAREIERHLVDERVFGVQVLDRRLHRPRRAPRRRAGCAVRSGGSC